MINTTGSTHPALDKITRITPSMSSPPGEEPAAWLAQIIQFWLGPSPKAPRPSGKPWIVPNGPRPPPLNDDPWQD
jgi:hypothetical protein